MTVAFPTSAAGSTPAVSLSGLTKRFGRVTAVEGVSLEVPSGGVFGLLGPNGSGKTTLLAMVSGFIRPHRWTVTLLGRDGTGGTNAVVGRGWRAH